MSRNSHYSEPGTITYVVKYWDIKEEEVRLEEFDEGREEEAHTFATEKVKSGEASHSHVVKCEYINGYIGEIVINKRFEEENNEL